ncbi:MAG: chemotaxis protein, partial [Loktanella sp.]|nr:chemotaxis protein [Loktanella sp.]
MNSATPVSRNGVSQDYPFTDADFARIADVAHRRYGLYLQTSKKPLVYSRLTKRLRALGLTDFDAYCRLLSEPQGTQEHVHLLSALTTNVTHFFRESHHFTMLQDEIMPELIARAKAGNPVRIWSAACSAGQEAFSIAAVIRKAVPQRVHYDIKVLATDIDPQMIRRARQAEYDTEQID